MNEIIVINDEEPQPPHQEQPTAEALAEVAAAATAATAEAIAEALADSHSEAVYAEARRANAAEERAATAETHLEELEELTTELAQQTDNDQQVIAEALADMDITQTELLTDEVDEAEALAAVEAVDEAAAQITGESVEDEDADEAPPSTSTHWFFRTWPQWKEKFKENKK